MKNIFKLMGIAVLACGMMVACNKPEEEDNNNNNNNNNNQQEQTNKLTISFNGTTWDAKASIFVNENQNGPFEGYLYFYAFKDASDATAITSGSNPSNAYVDGFLETTVGQFDYQSSQGDYVEYVDPTDIYYYSGDDQNAAGNYLRWNCVKDSFVENITAVDLNALTMSCTFSCDHFDLEQYEAAGGQSYGTLTTMNGEMKSFHWDEWYK